jgi:hypothetical protein
MALTLLYLWYELRICQDAHQEHRFWLAHSVVFSVLGLGTIIPWMGIFVSRLTPMGSLYLSLTIWAPMGFYLSHAAGFIFMIANVVIGISAVRMMRSSAAKAPAPL